MLTLFYIIIFIELLTVFYNLFKFLLYKLFSSSNKQHNNVKNSNNDFPKIIQQYSNYFSNYSSQSFIMKGFAIYQTAFEFRNRFNKQLYF